MPEMPEIEAHAERLSDAFVGRRLEKFHPFNFTALKTAVPLPDAAYGHELTSVGRRGKYLLLHFEPLTMVIHLMQGGRLLPDEKLAKKPRGGQARLLFDDGPALLLTEQGTERRAGIWCVDGDADLDAVLDDQLRVREIDGLRVCDAAAMPTQITGNLYATVVAMAEKAADMILQRPPPPPPRRCWAFWAPSPG